MYLFNCIENGNKTMKEINFIIINLFLHIFLFLHFLNLTPYLSYITNIFQ